MDQYGGSDHPSKFELLEIIGEGSYGSVHKARNRDTKRIFAIKIIPVEGEQDELDLELKILREVCQSKFIINYYGSNFYGDELWIVMEYCGVGSVSDLIAAMDTALTEEQISIILACALQGLAYLHERRNIHRDVKAGNILLTNDGAAKLADFGVSAQMNHTMSKRRTVIGTPFWMAPEVIQESSYDGKADIWSLGITAIEMAEGDPPHADIHPMRAIFMIPSKPPPTLTSPSQWSPEFNGFISQCLIKNPNDRPDSKTLMDDPFIRKAVNNKSSKHVLTKLVEDNLEAIRLLREERSMGEAEQVVAGGQSIGTLDATGLDGTGLDGAGTMVYAGNNVDVDSGTMIYNGAGVDTMVYNGDNNTMVTGTMVHTGFDVDSGTMVQSSGGSPSSANKLPTPEPSFMRYMRQGQGSGQLDVPSIAADLADEKQELSIEEEAKAARIKRLKEEKAELEQQFQSDYDELKMKYDAKLTEYKDEIKALQ